MVPIESQIFKMIGKGFLKWYDGGGENGLTQKKEFEVKMFFSSKDCHPYPHVRLFGAFFVSLSFSFFSMLLSLFFFNALSLYSRMNSGIFEDI
jgi:hypothetical protein